MLGVSTGGRISELLSLQIGGVWQNGKPVKDLLFARNIVKGGRVNWAVPVNIDGRQLKSLSFGTGIGMKISRRTVPCFRREMGTEKKSDNPRGHNLLKKSFDETGLNGHLATIAYGKVSHNVFMIASVIFLPCRKCSDTKAAQPCRSI
ncbi:hypothetical protein F4Z99_17605 [Candidatus Poribacteria bacterium]|nr:hypothetical protein [Candidatus Poribacteria bacterium]MYA98659.1 hypothetical protein [Candidatus Poribacteria bacterium]